jgi:transposase IS116/IS110/IS902 family protein
MAQADHEKARKLNEVSHPPHSLPLKTFHGLDLPDLMGAVAMFRIVLKEYLELSRLRDTIACRAASVLADSSGVKRLMTIPGIGPAIALMILAKAADLRRFHHYCQFLSLCGMNLSTQQSGRFRGVSRSQSMAMLDSARPFGWRRKVPCACARIVFDASLIVTFASTHATPISAARLMSRSRPNWHGSLMAWSRPELIIAPSSNRRYRVGEPSRYGPLGRLWSTP